MTATLTAVVESRMPLSGGDIAFTSAGTGPEVLLLIHGLGGTRQTWRHLIPVLSRTHTVIALDLPGHGESDPPAGDYSLGAHACAVRDLLLALGHRRATLVGHSLGGGVALQAAYQFPERVDRLVLISSGGLGTEVAPILRAATLPGAETMVMGLSRIPAVLTRSVLTLVPPLAASPDAGPLALALRGLAGRQQRRAFVRTAHAVIDWRGQSVSASRQLSLLRDVPVLVAWGVEDTTIPLHHQRTFAESVPHAVMVEIPAAGHFPHETSSEQLLAAMEGFLATTNSFEYSEAEWVEILTKRQTSRLSDVLSTRRIVDLAIGTLVELRGCSELEAVRELVLSGHETGRDTSAIAQALVSLVAGDEADDGETSDSEYAAVLDRWARLVDAEGRLKAAALDDPEFVPSDVSIRYGGVDDYTRC